MFSSLFSMVFSRFSRPTKSKSKLLTVFLDNFNLYSLFKKSPYDSTCMLSRPNFFLSFPTTQPPFPIMADLSGLSSVIIQIQPPERNTEDSTLMHVARSFDINKPGSGANKIKGGVIGGTLVQGTFKLGDTIEIRPGPTNNGERITLKSEIIGLEANGEQVEEIGPGGLVGIATKLDPSLTKSDSLSGTVAGEEGTLPEVLNSFKMEANLLDRVVGTKEERDVAPIKLKEPLMINCGTTTTIGVVTSTKKNDVEVTLKLPVCASPGDRVALSRRVGARWRLIGYGIIK